MDGKPDNAPSPRGGSRPGAGRKKGGGLHLTESIQVSVTPEQKKVFTALGGTKWIRSVIDRRLNALPPGAARLSRSPTRLRIRLMDSPVHAGFPSPATDYVQDEIDPVSMLTDHAESTFFLRTEGESMIGAGIFPGDLLVVDRALEPRSGDVVIANVNNEFTVKRYYRRGGVLELRPENPDFPVLRPREGDEWSIVGVVTRSVHPFRK
ncbi:translesion error-prone DNA polymerase V autoproteolytic subunit [Mesosutterella sp. AGMB02718]|uniref:Translesion error-prone DNA polymerase V autoproteolytic subunit n=1 Tax=Mesosutterella faecium TaxID=2925194 RepID=A0ABT7INN0_9BURK|nr:translesion error-prone DNA polymerase V autoproteolytic subunit [Mesosutterella sp. AGMB02718]MDL2059996.1 translesion error-prone DNA polymerase V autoproteolytic subunit [Mesosutterella sp. AGMB02718]